GLRYALPERGIRAQEGEIAGRALSVLHRADDRARLGEAGAREQAAAGAGEERVRPALPAESGSGASQHRRSRGADPLAKPGTGPGAAAAVHSAAGRDRVDPAGRLLGVKARVA